MGHHAHIGEEISAVEFPLFRKLPEGNDKVQEILSLFKKDQYGIANALYKFSVMGVCQLFNFFLKIPVKLIGFPRTQFIGLRGVIDHIGQEKNPDFISHPCHSQNPPFSRRPIQNQK